MDGTFRQILIDMSLPFLNAKKIASVMMAKTRPDGSVEDQHMEDEHDPALQSAAEDLISAVHMKDSMKVASALKAAFEIMDSNDSYQPDEEMGE